MKIPTSSKLLRACLAVFFIVQNCIFLHAAETTIWAQRKQQLASLPLSGGNPASLMPVASSPVNFLNASSKKLIPSAPWLPQSITPYANMNRVYLSEKEDAKTVLLIQDAHLQSEAQKNIAGVLTRVGDVLKKQGSSLVVGMEATDVEKADYSFYNDYPHRNPQRVVAEAFLEADVINGVEFAAIGYVGDDPDKPVSLPLDIIGLENQAEYDANVAALRASVPLKPKAEAALMSFKTVLAGLKKTHYSKALFSFDRKQTGFADGSVSVPDYVLYLDSQVPASSKEVRGLIEAVLIEEVLDFEKVETERKRLLTALVPRLKESEISTLTQLSALFRSGEVTYADYYDYLKSVAKRHGVAFKNYPELNLYVQYVLKSDDIDPAQLFKEIRILEKAVQDEVARTPQQKKIASLSEDAHLLAKLINHVLTEEEWQLYLSRVDHVRKIPSRLIYLDTDVPDALEEMTSQWVVFEDFYHAAVARNKTMADRIALGLDQSEAEFGALVAGGFHANGLMDELKKRDFHVIELSPKMSKIEEGPTTLDFIAENKTPLDQLLAGAPIFLNLVPHTAKPGPAADTIARRLRSASHVLKTGRPARLDLEGLSLLLVTFAALALIPTFIDGFLYIAVAAGIALIVISMTFHFVSRFRGSNEKDKYKFLVGDPMVEYTFMFLSVLGVYAMVGRVITIEAFIPIVIAISLVHFMFLILFYQKEPFIRLALTLPSYTFFLLVPVIGLIYPLLFSFVFMIGLRSLHNWNLLKSSEAEDEGASGDISVDPNDVSGFAVSVEVLLGMVRHFKGEIGLSLEFHNRNDPKPSDENPSSLALHKTFSPRRVTGQERGVYVVVDWGGTNGTLQLVELKGNGAYEVIKKREFAFTKKEIEDARRVFTKRFPREIKALLRGAPVAPAAGVLIAAQPLQQDALDSAILLDLTKGWSQKENNELIGENLPQLLSRNLGGVFVPASNDAQNPKNVFNYEREYAGPSENVSARYFVVKDGRLYTQVYKGELDSQAEDAISISELPEADFSGVDGTGTNIDGNVNPHGDPDARIFEAGDYDFGGADGYESAVTTPDEDAILELYRPIRQQKAEKRIAGVGIGEIFRLRIKSLMRHGFGSPAWRSIPALDQPRQFDSAYLSRMLAASGDLEDIERLFLELRIQNLWFSTYKPVRALYKSWFQHKIKVTDQERQSLQNIARAIVWRSARLLATQYVGAISHVDPKFEQQHTIAIEGSVFTKVPGYALEVWETIKSLVGENANNVVLVGVRDADGIGAAINSAAQTQEPQSQKTGSRLSSLEQKVDKAIMWKERLGFSMLLNPLVEVGLASVPTIMILHSVYILSPQDLLLFFFISFSLVLFALHALVLSLLYETDRVKRIALAVPLYVSYVPVLIFGLVPLAFNLLLLGQVLAVGLTSLYNWTVLMSLGARKTVSSMPTLVKSAHVRETTSLEEPVSSSVPDETMAKRLVRKITWWQRIWEQRYFIGGLKFLPLVIVVAASIVYGQFLPAYYVYYVNAVAGTGVAAVALASLMPAYEKAYKSDTLERFISDHDVWIEEAGERIPDYKQYLSKWFGIYDVTTTLSFAAGFLGFHFFFSVTTVYYPLLAIQIAIPVLAFVVANVVTILVRFANNSLPFLRFDGRLPATGVEGKGGRSIEGPQRQIWIPALLDSVGLAWILGFIILAFYGPLRLILSWQPLLIVASILLVAYLFNLITSLREDDYYGKPAVKYLASFPMYIGFLLMPVFGLVYPVLIGFVLTVAFKALYHWFVLRRGEPAKPEAKVAVAKVTWTDRVGEQLFFLGGIKTVLLAVIVGALTITMSFNLAGTEVAILVGEGVVSLITLASMSMGAYETLSNLAAKKEFLGYHKEWIDQAGERKAAYRTYLETWFDYYAVGTSVLFGWSYFALHLLFLEQGWAVYASIWVQLLIPALAFFAAHTGAILIRYINNLFALFDGRFPATGSDDRDSPSFSLPGAQDLRNVVSLLAHHFSQDTDPPLPGHLGEANLVEFHRLLARQHESGRLDFEVLNRSVNVADPKLAGNFRRALFILSQLPQGMNFIVSIGVINLLREKLNLNGIEEKALLAVISTEGLPNIRVRFFMDSTSPGFESLAGEFDGTQLIQVKRGDTQGSAGDTSTTKDTGNNISTLVKFRPLVILIGSVFGTAVLIGFFVNSVTFWIALTIFFGLSAITYFVIRNRTKKNKPLYSNPPQLILWAGYAVGVFALAVLFPVALPVVLMAVLITGYLHVRAVRQKERRRNRVEQLREAFAPFLERVQPLAKRYAGRQVRFNLSNGAYIDLVLNQNEDVLTTLTEAVEASSQENRAAFEAELTRLEEASQQPGFFGFGDLETALTSTNVRDADTVVVDVINADGEVDVTGVVNVQKMNSKARILVNAKRANVEAALDQVGINPEYLGYLSDEVPYNPFNNPNVTLGVVDLLGGVEKDSFTRLSIVSGRAITFERDLFVKEVGQDSWLANVAIQILQVMPMKMSIGDQIQVHLVAMINA